MSPERRPLGLRLIIAYKFVKAPIMLALALWLSIYPTSAIHVGKRLVHDLSEGGITLGRLARWMNHYLTLHWATDVAIVAWIDGIVTAIEGALLWRGSAWGEWIVVVAIAVLLPFEALAILHPPSPLRFMVLLVNAGIVAYLIYRRIEDRRRRHQVSGKGRHA